MYSAGPQVQRRPASTAQARTYCWQSTEVRFAAYLLVGEALLLVPLKLLLLFLEHLLLQHTLVFPLLLWII